MKLAGTLFMFFVLFSCEQPTEPTSPTIDSVTISPSEAELFVGDTLQFGAVVEGDGDFDSTVAWYVNNTVGGNTTYGVVTSSGFYTAPDTISIDSLTTVKAVSITDSTKYGSAMVYVLSKEPEWSVTSVAISPRSATLSISQSIQFTATVTGVSDFDSTITWYVNSTAGGNTEYGVVTPEGLYTAPATVPTETQATIRAMSIADTTKWGSAVVSIYAVESIIVSPQYVTVEITQSVQFTALVAGTGNFDTSVLWYINGVESGSDTYGTVTTDGLYIAPETVPIGHVNDARVIVLAKSTIDSLVLDSAIVDLYVIDSVAISAPQSDSLFVHQEQRFSMLIYGEGNPPGFVSYSVNGIEGGSERYGYINGGIYTAPPTVPYSAHYPWDTETITVRVALTEDTDRYSATMSFFITSGITYLTIDPVYPTVIPGDTIQFTFAIYGNPVDSTVKWFVYDGMGGGFYEGGNSEYGTISETGLYVAPSEIPQGTDVFVLVRSAVDIQKGANADIFNF